MLYNKIFKQNLNVSVIAKLDKSMLSIDGSPNRIFNNLRYRTFVSFDAYNQNAFVLSFCANEHPHPPSVRVYGNNGTEEAGAHRFCEATTSRETEKERNIEKEKQRERETERKRNIEKEKHRERET